MRGVAGSNGRAPALHRPRAHRQAVAAPRCSGPCAAAATDRVAALATALATAVTLYATSSPQAVAAFVPLEERAGAVVEQGAVRYELDGMSAYGMIERSSPAELCTLVEQ